MTTEAIMEKALAQAEKLQANVKKYEFARASCEMLEESDSTIVIQIKKKDSEELMELLPLPEAKIQKIVNTIRSMYQSEIDEAEKEVQSVIKSHESIIESQEDATKHDEVVIRQNGKDVKVDCSALAAKKKSFINEDFEAAVNDMIAESKQPIVTKKEQKPEVAPVQPKRIFTKDIISDKDLKQYYFKDGLTVKEIARAAGVNESALYKRIEVMKKQQAANAKECASSK